MGEKNENTNLASEFYILSMLHRNCIDATLTLGNKKSVDIVIVNKKGEVITLDVKGAQKKSGSFPMENFIEKKNHYYAFVILKGLEELPEVFIVPSEKIDVSYPQLKEVKGGKLLYHSPDNSRHTVDFGRLRKLKNLFQNNWDSFK